MADFNEKPKKKFKFAGLVEEKKPTVDLNKLPPAYREALEQSMLVNSASLQANDLTNRLQEEEALKTLRGQRPISTGLDDLRNQSIPKNDVIGTEERNSIDYTSDVSIDPATNKPRKNIFKKEESVKQGEKTDYSLGAKDYLKAVTFMPDGMLDYFGVGKPNEPSLLEKIYDIAPVKPKVLKDRYNVSADELIKQIVEETEKNNIDDNNYFDLLMKGGAKTLFRDTFGALGINLPKSEQLREDIQRQKRDATKSFIEQLPLVNPEVTGELAGFLLQLGVLSKGISEPVVNKIIGSNGQYVDDTLKGAENLFAKVNPGIVGRTQSVGADGIKTLLSEGNAPSKIYSTMLKEFTERFGPNAGEQFKKYAPRVLRDNITFGAPTALNGLNQVTQGKMEFEDYAKQLLGTSALATAFALNPFNEPLQKTVQKLDDMVSKTKLSGLTKMSTLGVGQEQETATRLLEQYLKQNGLSMADAEAISLGKTLKYLPESVPEYAKRFAKGLVYDATVPGIASQTPAVLSGEPIDGKQLLHDAVMNTAFRIMHLSGRGETEARYEKPGFEPKPQAEQLSDGTTPSDVIPSFDPTKVTPEMKNKVLLLKDMVEEHNNTTDLKKKQALETQIEIVSQPDAPIEKTADGDIVVDGMEDLLAEVDFTDEGLGVSAPVAPDKQINGNRENSKLKDAPVEIDALATKIVNGVKNFTPEELQLQQNESKNLEKAITKAAQKKVTSIESKKLEKIEELNKIKKFGDNVGDAMNNLLDNAKREVVSKGIPENNNTDTAQFLFTPEEQEAIDLMNKHFETEDFKENTNISERIKYEENFLNERKNKVSKKYGLKQEVTTTKEKPVKTDNEVSTKEVKPETKKPKKEKDDDIYIKGIAVRQYAPSSSSETTPQNERYFISTLTPGKKKVFISETDAKPVKLSVEGDFFRYKNAKGQYNISEGKSGQLLASEKTLQLAIADANNKIRMTGEQKFKELIEKKIQEQGGISPRYEKYKNTAPLKVPDNISEKFTKPEEKPLPAPSELPPIDEKKGESLSKEFLEGKIKYNSTFRTYSVKTQQGTNTGTFRKKQDALEEASKQWQSADVKKTEPIENKILDEGLKNEKKVVLVKKDAAFDMMKIKNRRFMFNKDSGELILGTNDIDKYSHNIEIQKSGAKGVNQDFTKGWIGTGKNYPNGIIHFAPGIRDIDLKEYPGYKKDLIETVNRFKQAGANEKTIIRGVFDGSEIMLSEFEQKIKSTTTEPPITKEKLRELGKKKEVVTAPVVEKQVEKLVDESKPSETGVTWKQQKSNVLAQATEIKKIIDKHQDKDKNILEEDAIKELKAKGYKVVTSSAENGSKTKVEIDIMGDGKFKFPVKNIDKFLEEIQTKFPEKPPAKIVINRSKGQTGQDVSLGSSGDADTLKEARENYETAVSSGDKKVIEATQKILDKEIKRSAENRTYLKKEPTGKPAEIKSIKDLEKYQPNADYYSFEDGEYRLSDGKPLTLNYKGDFFIRKRGNSYSVFEGTTGYRLSHDKPSQKDAVIAANEKVKENGGQQGLETAIMKSLEKRSISPRYDKIPETPKAVEGGKETPAPSKTEATEHFRIGKSPQLYTKVRELPFDAKTDAEGEKYFEVKNETTGEVSTVEQSDLKKVNTRTEEQKAADSKKATENKIKKLEKELENATDRFEKVRLQKKIQQLQKVEEKPIKTASAPLPQISPDVPKIKNEQAVQKLEDYGEKIGGAKKDLWKRLDETTEADIINQPLSKSFPEPDYTKLFEDKIINQSGAIFMKFLYDNIPAKPRNAWKVKLWAKKVQTAIDQVKSIVTGDFFKDTDFNEKLQKLQDTAGTWLLREYDTHDKVMKAFNFPENPVNLGNYEIKKYWGRDHYTIKNGKFFLSEHPTVEKAVEKLKEILESNKDKKGKKETVFNVFQDRKTKDIFIGKRGATDTVRLVEGFKTAKEAQTYLDGNREAVNAMWEALKVIPEERRLTNRPRVGIDYRKGKNISSEDFGKKFGFRGVEFGNWVDGKERQTHVNEAYDALMDLATVLNVEPEALSLAGELGFAFGARGSGNALAHYEPVKVVINLTKKKGAGSLAHEWWHAMDNYFSRARGDKSKFLTEMPIQKNVIVDGKAAKDTSVRKEMVDAFYGVIDAIRKSGIPERSGKIDATRSKSYWGTDVEMTARSFENFVINKLAETDQLNDYLANFLDMEEWGASSRVGLDNYPYPLKDEAPAINEAYQQLFDAIQTKTDESGKKVLYSLADKSERDKIVSSAKKDGTYLKAPNGKDTNLNAGQWVTVRTENFKKWFGDWEKYPAYASKVVDENGEPLVVYSGHFNTEMYGEKYIPRKTEAGGFYSSEDPLVASNYSLGKAPDASNFNNGDQYRVEGKNGKLTKKLSQYELSDEQKKKLDELAAETDKYGEYEYGIHQMKEWIENNKNYEQTARRMSYNGGMYNLQNIYDYNDWMGYNIAYNSNNHAEAAFQRQQKNESERILDALGIKWSSHDWSQPGVYPIFLDIRKPIDASEPFPEDLLKALEDKAKYERKDNDEIWSKDYSLKRWVKSIKEGDEYWSAMVPSKALPIIQSFGYDGIKERGTKGAPADERQINWIAFRGNQIKSSTGNKGTFDSSNDNIRYSLQDIKSDVNVAGMDVLVTKLNKAFPGTEVVFATNKQVLEHLNDKYGTKLSIGEDAPLGFLDTDGKIYINTDRATMETPIHEFGEIWAQWAQDNKPGLYEQGIELIKKDEALMAEINDKYGDAYGGNKKMLFNEALVTAIGRNGEKMYENMEPERKKKLLQRLKEWISKLFDRIKNAFRKTPEEPGMNVDGITPTSSMEDFLNAVGKDLLGGKTIADTRNDVQEAAKYSVGDNVMSEVINGFYSPIEKRLNEFKQEKVSANKWLTIIGKGDEAKYTGVMDWLQAKKPTDIVSKSDIMDYMKNNRIEVKEKMLSKEVVGNDIPKEVVDALKSIDNLGFGSAKEAIDSVLNDPDWWNNHEVPYEKMKIISNYVITELPPPEHDKPSLTVFKNREKYFELLVTLPQNKEKPIYKVVEKQGNYPTPKTWYHVVRIDGGDAVPTYYDTMEKAQATVDRLNANKINQLLDNNFTQGHYKVPNVLVHLRAAIVRDAEGRKGLALEEEQSDWGQKGKKEGFTSNDPALKKQISDLTETELEMSKQFEDLNDEIRKFKAEYAQNMTQKALDRYDDAQNEKGELYIERRKIQDKIKELKKQQGRYPLAPFVTDTNAWVKLGLKFALRKAIEEDCDFIAWTTGEQQNERYDLSKQVDEIYTKVSPDGTYSIEAAKDGSAILDREGLSTKDLEELVGKDFTEKIIKAHKDEQNYREGAMDEFAAYQKELMEQYGNANERSLERYLQHPSNTEPETAKKYFELQRDANAEGISKHNMKVGHRFSGVDLKVGGKGMIGFYGSPKDNNLGIIGKVAESMFGKGSVKTSEIIEKESPLNVVAERYDGTQDISKLKGIEESKTSIDKGDWILKDENGDYVWATYGDSGKTDAIASYTDTYNLEGATFKVSTKKKQYVMQQHSVDITPAMRSEVKRGLPLFQLGDKGETKINLENWKKIGAAVFAQKGDMLKADFKNALLKVINAQRLKAGLELWEEIGLSPKQLDDIYKAGKEYYKQLKESQKVKKVNSEEKVEKPEPVEKPKDKTEDVKSVTENVSNEPKPTGLKQRRFAKQVMESPDISDEIKKGLKNTMYDPISNKQSFADAKKMIETEGVQGAIDEIKNKDSEYDQRTRNMATVILTKTLSSEADKLMKAGEEEEAKKLYEKAISIIDVPQEELRTQLGQAIQVLSLFKYGTPEGALYAATKLKKKRDKGTKEKVKGEIEILKKKIDELQKKLAGEVVKEPKIKEKLTAAEKLAKKVEGSLEPPEPKETDPVAHLVQTLYDVIREKGLVPKFEENPTKEKLIELVGKAVKNDKGYEKVWDEAKEIVKNDFIDNAEALEVLDKYFAENHENPFTNAQIEKVVNKGIKEKEINLTELVKKHFSFAEESKRSLTEKLIQDAGLQPDEAGKLARAIEAKFEELATLRKRKILDNRFKEKNTEIKDRIQLFEKVIELSNLGALNDADYTKAFAEHLNTGPITPEQAAKIVELANKVQETPEGWQQDRAITDLYVYIEEMNGLDNTQVLWAMYYPAILSGVTTQFRNIFGNTFSLAAEAINRNVTDYPMGAVVLAKGLYRGMVEGAMVLKEGYGQNIGHMNKFSESVNQLVMDKHKFTTFGGGNANPVNAYLNSLKYVSRFLVAQDKVFYMGLKELEEYSLAKIIAKKEGLKGKALSARVKEILGNDPSKIELAKETATAEGLKGFNYKRRVWELVEKQRPADIVAEADSFASRGTFNYEPKGMIGEIAKGIQRFQRNKAGKYTKFIVPFTNIVANVLNNALDFAPIYGHKRWWWGYSGTEGRDAEPRTQRQKDQQLFRANVGMALFGALLTGVLNGLISVTTVGTGNNDKNKQLRETGWRPYSVKIGDKWYSYMGTPLAVPFIVAGGVHDMMHYKKDWDEQTFAQTFSASVFLSAGAIMDMSFLSSAKDFMTIFDPRSENKGESWGKRFIAQVPSAFVPNIAKQTARLFDNNQYEANTITEMLLRNVGIAQDKFGLKQKINILGQPIKKDALFETIGPPFGISETNEPVWNYLIKNSAYVSVPNKNTVIYDTELGKDRAMTSDEYYTYVKKSGEKIRTILEKNLSELEKLDSESARIFVRKLTDDARDNTRQEMFAPKTDESINAYDFDAKFNMDKIMVNLKIDKYDLRDENGKSVNYTPSKDEFEEGKIDMDRVEEKLYAHIDKLDDALEDKKISEEYRNREIDKLNELLKEYGWATIGK